MAKVLENKTRPGNWIHFCPGCNYQHEYQCNPENARSNRDGSTPIWQFNGDVDNPSFTPSMNIVGSCHYYVTDGKIIYQSDCKHALAGQTVELPDMESY